jgi:hypothetical protein
MQLQIDLFTVTIHFHILEAIKVRRLVFAFVLGFDLLCAYRLTSDGSL